MDILLVNDSDPILKEKMPVFTGDFEKIRNYLPSLFSFMERNKGIGLAAPQIGWRMNFFIMNTDGKKRCVVNPVIIKYSENKISIKEGCLSFPKEKIYVTRSESILVNYENEFGENITEDLNGISARCFLHEEEHLRGICIIQYK